MKKKDWLKISVLGVCLIAAMTFFRVAHAQQQALPKHPPVKSDGKNLIVQLCDGQTNIEVPGVDPNGRLTAEQAQAVSHQLMSMWMAKADKATADAWMKEANVATESNASQDAPKEKKPVARQGTGRTDKAVSEKKESKQLVDFSARDYSIWDKELAKEIDYGNQIFHSDQLIGSTNGIACAMCHPNGANTHPETYPKFQLQLKRVALLRDMINWCIENPARGTRLAADDPKMRALEAYIMAQRKGTAMQPGKH
ncbi:MAG: cytochrome C [Acidobacteria bacterium]|nr:cytochrome C [Acidobacteriota bacterium]